MSSSSLRALPRPRRSSALPLLVLLAAGCASGRAPEATAPPGAPAGQAPGAPTAQTAGTPTAQGAGTLALYPGDAVKLTIWKEPDLSGTFRVDESNILTLPLLGPRNVSGVSADELKAQLLEDYAYHLKNPAVEVGVLRRISVSGQVRTPGLYDVEPSMRLGDVLALAGGFTPDANRDEIQVVREGVEVAEASDPSAPIGNRVRSGDQLVVGERTWLARNGRVLLGVAITATGFLLRFVL